MSRIRSLQTTRRPQPVRGEAPQRARPARREVPFEQLPVEATPPAALPAVARPAGAAVLEALSAGGSTVIASPSLRLLDDARGAADADTHGALWTVDALHAAGHPVVPWTINDESEMWRLLELGADGFITDSPDLGFEAVEAFGGLLDAHGLIDPAVFSLQGHRGARDLRPESTLPSMEVALDHLCNTLEGDVNLTRDGVAVLSHEPIVDPRMARHADGSAYAAPVLIKDLTVAELQSRFVLDQKLPERPRQQNELALSPVSVAFARERGLSHAYAMPTVEHLFDFTRFYADWYRSGPGREAPDAERRWRNAERVCFNLETKVLPSHEKAGTCAAVGPLTRELGRVIQAAGLESRSTIESFDDRSLRIVQAELPAVRTVYLFDGKTEEPSRFG